MTNIKLRAAFETAKLIGISVAIGVVVLGIFYTVPAYVLAMGAVTGLFLYFLHMIYDFKLESLMAAEREKQFDNNSKV